MDILFYKLQDEVNDVKKTRTLTAVEGVYPLTVTGVLRGSASKVAPTIEFSKDITYFNDYNYCYIPDFKRYYFVDNPVSIRTGYCSLDFRVDVLTSFLTQPDAQYLDCFVARSSKSGLYSSMIPDKMVQFSTEPEVTVSEPTSTTTGNSENVTFSSSPSFNIVLTTCIEEDTPDVKQYGSPTMTNISIPSVLQDIVGTTTINSQYFKPSGTTACYVTDFSQNAGIDPTYPEGDMWIILNRILQLTNYSSAVYGIKAFPFSVPKSNSKIRVYAIDTVFVDGRQLPDYDGSLKLHYSPTYNSGCLVLKDFTLSYPSGYNEGIFSMYEPYSRCDIFIPFVGWYNINIKENLNCRIIVFYNVNYISGEGTVYIYNKTKNLIVYQTGVQLGIDIDFSVSNMLENRLRSQNNATSFVTGLISSVAMTAVGIATWNPIVAVGGAIGGVSSVSSYITNENILVDKATTHVSNNSSVSGIYGGLKVLVKWSRLRPLNFFSTNKTDFIEHFGCPVNAVKLYSQLRDTNDYHNYAEITDLHISRKVGSTIYKITDITFSETEELKKLCSEGIYV